MTKLRKLQYVLLLEAAQSIGADCYHRTCQQIQTHHKLAKLVALDLK